MEATGFVLNKLHIQAKLEKGLQHVVYELWISQIFTTIFITSDFVQLLCQAWKMKIFGHAFSRFVDRKMESPNSSQAPFWGNSRVFSFGIYAILGLAQLWMENCWSFRNICTGENREIFLLSQMHFTKHWMRKFLSWGLHILHWLKKRVLWMHGIKSARSIDQRHLSP